MPLSLVPEVTPHSFSVSSRTDISILIYIYIYIYIFTTYIDIGTLRPGYARATIGHVAQNFLLWAYSARSVDTGADAERGEPEVSLPE